MSCRCSDISDCKKDINTINDILDVLNESQNTNKNVFEEHDNLIPSSRQTFTTANMDELNKAEQELNKDVSEIIPNLIKSCEAKIENLEDELESLEREDDKYHEEKNKDHDNE